MKASNPKRGRSSSRSPVRHSRLAFLAAAILVLYPIATIGDVRYRAFHIPSPSMAPTVQMNDFVMVEITPVVRRCDIVVYRKPAPTGTPEVDYIRRVIALPGTKSPMSAVDCA